MKTLPPFKVFSLQMTMYKAQITKVLPQALVKQMLLPSLLDQGERLSQLQRQKKQKLPPTALAERPKTQRGRNNLMQAKEQKTYKTQVMP